MLRRGQEVVALPPKAAELLWLSSNGPVRRFGRRNSSTSYGEARSSRRTACGTRAFLRPGGPALTTSIPFHGEGLGIHASPDHARRSRPSPSLAFLRSPIFGGSCAFWGVPPAGDGLQGCPPSRCGRFVKLLERRLDRSAGAVVGRGRPCWFLAHLMSKAPAVAGFDAEHAERC